MGEGISASGIYLSEGMSFSAWAGKNMVLRDEVWVDVAVVKADVERRTRM